MGQDPIVVVGAKRTPFGAFGGALKDLSATDLAVQSSKACLEHNQISPDCIDHITFGNVIPSSSDAAYLARHVGLKIGAPLSTPALTLNRLCGSGFEAITDGIRRLKLDEATVVLAGGTENMSQAPFTLRKSRFGYRMGHGEIEDTLVAGLFDSFAKLPMALTAERLAEKYGISREECDAFALESHHKAQAAYVRGLMGPELGEISVSAKRTDHVFSKDEHLRPDASLESLKKLKPVFKEDGVVTAGNASGICDGSASVGAISITVKTRARSDHVLLLTNVVLSKQRPSTEAADTKRRHFSAVLDGARDVLKHILPRRIHRTRSVLA